MKQIGAAIENFAFKAFDFNGRATLLEYWLMMPLVWGFIIFLFMGDVAEMWGMLSVREIPTLNPLYWDSLVVFVLTFFPRMSLTVRRLHDSGKSGKWVKLPFMTISSGFIACVFIFGGLATTNMTYSDDHSAAAAVGVTALLWMLVAGSAESAWDAVFVTVSMINAVGFDAIFAMAAELFSPPQDIDIAAGISQGLAENPGEGIALMLVPLFMIAMPFVTAFLHIFFMISPSKPDHDLCNLPKTSGASLRRKGEVSDNPFSGYKYLYPKSPEQEAASRARAKQEIKSLYQQRVLGGGQPV